MNSFISRCCASRVSAALPERGPRRMYEYVIARTKYIDREFEMADGGASSRF